MEKGSGSWCVCVCVFFFFFGVGGESVLATVDDREECYAVGDVVGDEERRMAG